MPRKLEEFLDNVPNSVLPPKDRSRVAKALRELDRAGGLHQETGKPALKREYVRELLKQSFPSADVDRRLEELEQAHPEALVAKEHGSKLKPAPFLDLLAHAGHPAAEKPYSFPPDASAVEVEETLRAKFGVPAEWLEPDHARQVLTAVITDQAVDTAVAEACPPVIVCVVNHIGFWSFMTLLLIFMVIALLTMVNPPGGAIAFVVVTGVITIANDLSVIIHCVNDPCWT